MFKKILIANRGEIAARIIRACQELNILTVAIASEADAGMPWVRLANERIVLEGTRSGDTYLNQAVILQAAADSGADAIHPGYGFLSENAAFARACAEHGLTFIGPPPAAIELMGSKAAARALAQRVGVPVVPGVDAAGVTDEKLAGHAAKMGYPVLVKASAGGGGKGMRVVERPDSLADALQAARSEALSSFGDDHILLEKYFPHIHHVEVQILADSQGETLHLFERECSIQRRHQKIVEETPSPTISPDLRQEITAAALRLAEAADYVNAGTVEFIVDANGGFYFLEMNTRLQVEHPITELVTGIDLVNWQIRIAAGQPLDFSQEQVGQRGHAIECRVYVEDPAQGFMPASGKISYYQQATGPGVRVDAGIGEGSEVSPFYDPMLAKVITWGQDREEARRKMALALQQTVILGVTTNIPYLLDILAHPSFVAGKTPTRFLETHFAGWQPEAALDDALLAAMTLQESRPERHLVQELEDGLMVKDPWALVGSWRNVT